MRNVARKKDNYLSKIRSFINNKEPCEIPLSKLTNDIDGFRSAVDILVKARVVDMVCSVTDKHLVISSKKNDKPREPLFISEVGRLYENDILNPVAEFLPGRIIYFTMSRTGRLVTDRMKGFIKAINFFDGSISMYTNKNQKLFGPHVILNYHPIIEKHDENF